MASFAVKLSRAFPKILLLGFLFGYMPYLVFKQSGCGSDKRPVDEVFKEKPVFGAPQDPGEAAAPGKTKQAEASASTSSSSDAGPR